MKLLIKQSQLSKTLRLKKTSIKPSITLLNKSSNCNLANQNNQLNQNSLKNQLLLQVLKKGLKSLSSNSQVWILLRRQYHSRLSVAKIHNLDKGKEQVLAEGKDGAIIEYIEVNGSNRKVVQTESTPALDRVIEVGTKQSSVGTDTPPVVILPEYLLPKEPENQLLLQVLKRELKTLSSNSQAWILSRRQYHSRLSVTKIQT